VVVFEKTHENSWKELGRTEVIQNTLNPDFVKKIVIEYHFEEQQRLNFAVYVFDDSSDKLEKHDFLGNCEATLGEIASSWKVMKPLKNGPAEKCGSIIVIADEVSSCKDELILDISGKGLDRKDLFGSSDPFLAFYRINEDGSRTIVHRTEEIRNTLNPNWKQMVLPTRVLVNGDHDRQLIISCLDWNRSGREALIGEASTTVNELLRIYHSDLRILNLVHPKKARRQKHYTNSGVLHLNLVKIEKVYSFLDYVQGGTELSCCIAIDFTASNGSPQVPDTLHYSTINHPSQYAMALQAVGEVISDYDSDNLFPAFGFGACVPPDNVVSHCFPLVSALMSHSLGYHQINSIISKYSKVSAFPLCVTFSTYSRSKRIIPHCSELNVERMSFMVHDYITQHAGTVENVSYKPSTIGTLVPAATVSIAGKRECGTYNEALEAKQSMVNQTLTLNRNIDRLDTDMRSLIWDGLIIKATQGRSQRTNNQLLFEINVFRFHSMPHTITNSLATINLAYHSKYFLMLCATSCYRNAEELFLSLEFLIGVHRYFIDLGMLPTTHNGHIDNPYCEGIQGAMAAYAHSLRTVKFHGPTNFAPIINTVASIARQAEPGTQYSILLILTDGIISDLPQTRAAIVNASSLPLSIIIVGVGPANFDEMEELDGDEIRLTSRGRAAVRDIVQFVPFRDFHDAYSVKESKRRLSKAVLAEIPDQLVSYMRMQGIKPLHSPNLGFKGSGFNGDCPEDTNQTGTFSSPKTVVPSAPPEY
ncbi:copine-8, partial [Clonorchis sinensis]